MGNFSNIEIWGQNRSLDPWNPYLTLDFHETCLQCASCGHLMFLEKICNSCQKINCYTYGFLQWPPGTSSGIQGIPRGPPVDLRGPPVGPWGPPVETRVLYIASLGSNACRLCDEFPSHPLFLTGTVLGVAFVSMSFLFSFLLCFLHLLCTFFIYRHISKIPMHICRSTRCPTFHEKKNFKNLKIWSPGGGQKFQIFKKFNVSNSGSRIWFMKIFIFFPYVYPDEI